MLPQYHTNSPALSEKRRQEFYTNQGFNLRGYTEQLAWYHQVCVQNPNDICMRTIFRLLYISADLCASVRACVSATDEYEKQYQIKYLWVNLHEAYKAIYIIAKTNCTFSKNEKYIFFTLFDTKMSS